MCLAQIGELGSHDASVRSRDASVIVRSRDARVIFLLLPANERQWDLFVGHTDRRVAVYHWSGRSNSLELVKQFSVSGQVSKKSL